MLAYHLLFPKHEKGSKLKFGLHINVSLSSFVLGCWREIKVCIWHAKKSSQADDLLLVPLGNQIKRVHKNQLQHSSFTFFYIYSPCLTFCAVNALCIALAHKVLTLQLLMHHPCCLISSLCLFQSTHYYTTLLVGLTKPEKDQRQKHLMPQLINWKRIEG